MKTPLSLRFQNLLLVLMTLSLIFSCSEENLDSQNPVNLDLQVSNHDFGPPDCTTQCLVKPTHQSNQLIIQEFGSAGPNEKVLDFSIHNTGTHLITYIQYLITQGNAKAKATIVVKIGDDEKVFEDVMSGPILFHSLKLPQDYKGCDEIPYYVRQEGLGQPLEISGMYKLVGACPDSFTDPRDGRTYKTVAIGNYLWMAENFAYDTPEGSWAYNNNESLVDTYGRLYDWETARTVAPEGWRLPTLQEWEYLMAYPYFEGPRGADSFKEAGTEHWVEPNYGDNSTGFTALPAGYYSGRSFSGLGELASFWTDSKYSSDIIYITEINVWAYYFLTDGGSISSGRSVRYIKEY